jgi:hypothetical protein
LLFGEIAESSTCARASADDQLLTDLRSQPYLADTAFGIFTVQGEGSTEASSKPSGAPLTRADKEDWKSTRKVNSIQCMLCFLVTVPVKT